MRPRRMSFSRGPKDCPLEIYRNKALRKSNDYFLPHWHPQMELIYVKKGSYNVFSLNGESIICQGDIYVIPPEEVHATRSMEENSAYVLVDFSLELITVPEGHFFFEGFLRPLREGTLRLPRCMHPGTQGYNEALAHFQLLDEADKASPDYKSRVFMAAMSLCLTLMPLCRIAQTEEPDVLSGVKGNDTVRRCQNYIGKYYGRQITLDELARLVHVHPNYLCRIFKKYAGQSVFEYINSIRISFATQFIRNSDDPIPAIAERCGFNSMSYFTKRFKQHTGQTPYAYSKLYKNR